MEKAIHESNPLPRGQQRAGGLPLHDELSQERLLVRVEQAVRRELGRRIRDLKVEICQEGVRIAGRCTTYYSKQLAQHAAMTAARGTPLVNDIVVE
ncbi:MAG: hypothetical protein K6T86_18720 [Pirellulales bacterium]|jgi:hypothetical protein|nr:hypothetical protein [Pirellulales bacterium]